ncbi:MAG TPA: hypothetical protein VFS56_00405 [Gemmatimonadaceae bacterium]|nr:hypothetical protein [Gemmatimonadaceae bacterium]
MAGSDLTSAHDASNPSHITRSDLAAVVEVYRRKSKKFDSLQTLGLWGGLVLGWLLLGLRPAFGLIDDYDPMFFFGGWGIGLTVMGAAAWNRRKAFAELDLPCASCGTPLLGRGNRKDVVSRAELVIATGVCPSCGSEFIAPAA